MNKIRLFTFVLILILTVSTSCIKNMFGHQDEDIDFTFAYLTDIHVQWGKDAHKGFNQAIASVNQNKPDFVLTGGDLIMDALGQKHSRADSLYTLFDSLASGFDMPLYNTMGNHEVYGWYVRDTEAENPEFGKKMYEKRIANRYYSFDHKNWHFIVLDGIGEDSTGGYYGYIDQEQIEWIKKDLEKLSEDKAIALSTHIPFVSSIAQMKNGGTASNGRGSIITNSKEVLELFKGKNLRLVLQGHLHFLEDINVNNEVHFITAGAVCAGWWSGKYNNAEEGYLLFKVKGDDFSWEYVDYGWEAVKPQ